MKKESVVALCAGFHEEISLKEWHDVLVYDPEGRAIEYAVMNRQGKPVLEVKLSGSQQADSQRRIVDDFVRSDDGQDIEKLLVCARDIGAAITSALCCLYLDADRATIIGVGYKVAGTGGAESPKYVVALRHQIDRHPEFTEGTYGGGGKTRPLPDGIDAIQIDVPFPLTGVAADGVALRAWVEKAFAYQTLTIRHSSSVDPSTAPVNAGWKASQLVACPDWQLVQQFNEFYGAAGVLKMEAYRRVDAYRLKYVQVAGESWVQKAETEFEMPAKTLRQYSRAWQAFEQAIETADVPEDLTEAFQTMGGGVWQVIGRMPEDTWPQMSEIALSVAANTGVGRGMAARVAAKGQEEGLLPKSQVQLRCPICDKVSFRHEFEKVSE